MTRWFCERSVHASTVLHLTIFLNFSSDFTDHRIHKNTIQDFKKPTCTQIMDFSAEIYMPTLYELCKGSSFFASAYRKGL